MPGQPIRRARREKALERARLEAMGLGWVPEKKPVRTVLYLDEVQIAYERLQEAQRDYEWAVKQALDHGETQGRIARKLGISQQAVSGFLRRRGLGESRYQRAEIASPEPPPGWEPPPKPEPASPQAPTVKPEKIKPENPYDWRDPDPTRPYLSDEVHRQDHAADGDDDQTQGVDRDGHEAS